ncbi:hypothetical protein ACJJJB_00190 (plasmid) [Microbulbifer sp. ANSA001]|uniref:hypothetical protein n=1 Tax=Microbulbifer sp. ANSA001 TaxID=3243358 RepID=UPI004042FE2D
MHIGEISEDRILLKHTTEWLTEKGVSKQQFARQHLLPSLEKSQLEIEEPLSADSYQNWFESRRKMISSMLSGKSAIPLAWKWAWIYALPKPYQQECLKELMALTGSFYLPLPSGTNDRVPTPSSLACLTREFSDVIASSKPAQDGMLDVRDEREELREYAAGLLDLVEKGVQELLNIQKGTGLLAPRVLQRMLNERLGNED